MSAAKMRKPMSTRTSLLAIASCLALIRGTNQVQLQQAQHQQQVTSFPNQQFATATSQGDAQQQQQQQQHQIHARPYTNSNNFAPFDTREAQNQKIIKICSTPDGSLVIQNADKPDEANHRCRLFNGVGPGLGWNSSLKATVPVYFEPTAGKPDRRFVRRGGRVDLRCDAFGDKPISIEWLKNKLPLAVDARISIRNDSLPNGLISQLNIKQAQRQDNAIYECATKNPYGRDRLPIELIVQEEPDSIQEIQVGPTNSRSVTIYWNEPYDGRSPIMSYIFQYKRIETDANATSRSDLMASQTDSGESQTGGTRLQSVAASQHEVDWQQAKRIVLQTASTTPSGGSVKSITIEKLDPSSRYLLRALAINSIGQSKYSQPMEFNTDEEAPDVGPVNIRASAVNSTSILVSWDEIPRNKHSGRISGYLVGYRVASNNSAAINFIHKPYIIGDQPQANSAAAVATSGELLVTAGQNAPAAVPSGRLETIIQDLRRDTEYEITVLAFNRRGSGPSADFVVCKTIEMEPPKPVRLSVSRELNDSIYIEWQRDPSDQNPVDYYALYVDMYSNSAEVRLSGNQTHYRATGLKCGTRYQFHIVAHNKVGKSAPSEMMSTSTSGTMPVMPSKTSLLKWVNSTCLLINLATFQENSCRNNFVNIRYRLERSTQALHDPTQATDSMKQTLTGGAGSLQVVGSSGLSPSHQALTMSNLQTGPMAKGSRDGSGHSLNSQPGNWTNVRPKGNQKQQQHRISEDDRFEYLCDLSPTGEYTIHVTAGNEVGRSEAEYTVVMSSDELRQTPLRDVMELVTNSIAYIPSLLVFLLAALLLVIVCLILYTTAIKYYQKFVIMQNQMRATRRAKADERRRRKMTGNKFLKSSSSSSSSSSSASSASSSPTNSLARHNQKLSELWADEYEECCDEDEEVSSSGNNNERLISGDERQRAVSEEANNNNNNSSNNNNLAGRIDADDEDEDVTDELHSDSSQELRMDHRRRLVGRADAAGQFMKQSAVIARGRSYLSNRHRPDVNQMQQRLLRPHHSHAHSYQHPSPQQQQHQTLNHSKYTSGKSSGLHSQYMSNLSNSFDSSSMDSAIMKKPFGCMSTTSSESPPAHGRFQCLNSKQYVKMNEYSMLPTISASLANPISDIYGTSQQFRPISGTPPSANSATTTLTTASNSAHNSLQNPNSFYYSTLRRATNMQTYLPQQQQQRVQRRQSQNMADIYGYYMAPPVQAQAQAAAVAAQQAANVAANSIFVPPQTHQIIYSAPNIRRPIQQQHQQQQQQSPAEEPSVFV